MSLSMPLTTVTKCPTEELQWQEGYFGSQFKSFQFVVVGRLCLRLWDLEAVAYSRGSKPEAEQTNQTFEGPFIVTREASGLKGLPAPQAVSPTSSWRHFWWNHSAVLLPLNAAITFSLRSICTGSQNVVWVQFLKFPDFLNDTYGNEENLSASILSYPQIGKFCFVHIGSGRPKTPFPQTGMLISE